MPAEEFDDLSTLALAIADEAFELPAQERESYIRSRCGGNRELYKRVLVYMQMHAPEDIDFRDRQFGNYKVLKKLHSGGQGQVYVAKRIDTPSLVAMKFLPPAAEESAAERRYRWEKQILANLNHDNIVKYIEYGKTEEGWRFIVMEYVDGAKNILVYCKEQRLTLDERLRLFLQLLSAVRRIHVYYLHRDLKPENVMVTDDSRLKLIDFGIAKPLYADVGLYEEAFEDYQPYSPEDASPEQLKREVVNIRSDIYQLGLILFQLLVEGRPFLAEGTSPEAYRYIRQGQPPPPSSRASSDGAELRRLPGTSALRNALRGDLDAIALRALQPRADLRYDSAADFAFDIQRYLGGDPVLANPGGRSYRVRKAIGKHRLSITLVSSVFVVLLLAFVQQWRANRILSAINSAALSVADGLDDDKTDLQRQLAAEKAALEQLQTLTKTNLIELKEQVRTTESDRIRIYAHIYERVANSLDPNLPEGEASASLKSSKRKILAQARDLWEQAGIKPKIDELDAQIHALGGPVSVRGASAGPDAAELASASAVSAAQLLLRIAELQASIGDVQNARQSIELAAQGLRDNGQGPEAAKSLARCQEQLVQLSHQGGGQRGK